MTRAVVLQQSIGSKTHPRQTTNHKRNNNSLLPAGNTLEFYIVTFHTQLQDIFIDGTPL